MSKKVEVDIDVDLGDGLSDVDKLVASVKELTDEMQSAKEESDGLGDGLDKAGKDGKKGLGGIATGFRGVGAAIKAAGIGLVIAAFVTLKEVLEKQQPVLDFIDTAFTSIGLAIDQVSSSLKGSGAEFSALTTIGKSLLTIFITPLKTAFFTIKGAIVGAQLVWEKSFFGGKDKDKIAELEASLSDVGDSFVKIKDDVVEAGTNIVNNIGEAIDEVVVGAQAVSDAVTDLDSDQIISDAKKTTALKNNAQIREAQNKRLFEQYDREAELLRQQRDDTTLTVDQRIAANDKLAGVLDKQEKNMLANAAAVVAAAQAEFDANATTENRVALINAQAEADAIRADVAGKRSEQLINEIALDNEKNESEEALEAKRKTRAENALALEQELKQARIDAGLEDPNATLDEILAKYEEKAELEDELYDIEKTKIEEQFKEKLISEEEKNAQLELAKFNHEKRKAKITSDSAKTEQAVTDARFASQMAFASSVGGAISALGQLAEEGSAQQKLLALSEIAIGTGTGFIQALNIAQKSAAGTGPAAAFAFPIFYATQIASVIGAVSKAKSALSKSKGGGSVPTFNAPSGGGAPNIGSNPASQPGLTTGTLGTSSGNDNLEGIGSETIGEGAGQNQVIKAFVVESDITEAQANASTIEDQAVIG